LEYVQLPSLFSKVYILIFRYHWEAEFQHWLGPTSHEPKDAAVNMLESTTDSKESQSSNEMEEEDVDSDNSEKGQRNSDIPPKDEMVLHDSQIHVLTSSKAAIFPKEDTKVVICSYGLVPLLIKSQAILPGIFKCAIVDESHMLVNANCDCKSFGPLHCANTCFVRTCRKINPPSEQPP
jgi:hypothetical protein